MAITAATKTSDFSGFLTREQSAPIFDLAYKSSVVQQLAPKVELGINGQSIPVVTGKVTANWVSEGAQKPASSGSMALKTMDPKKIAAIAVISAEVVRANPGNYVNLIRPQIAEAFALAFDAAAFHGTNSPFGTNLDTGSLTQEFTGTTPSFTTPYVDLNAGFAALVNSGKKLTGWAFDSRMEPVLNGTLDSSGRPLFIDKPLIDTAGPVRSGTLMGRSCFVGDGVYASANKVYGYAGDWSQVAWGAVGGISYKVSTEAAVTINGSLVSLFENNLVAVLAEAEYGFLVNDPSAFVKFTNAV